MARKKQYRIRNWAEYNKGLVNRGSLTIWFDENSIAKWHEIKLTGVRGRPCDYSNTAILCALSLRNLFRLPLLQRRVLKVSQATGDGAYDTHDCYKAAIDIGAKPCFPSRINAAKNNPTDQAWRLRNQVVGKIRDKGLKKWKIKNNYHRRSLSETAFSRLKKILGASASGRRFENQVTELALRCHMLNKMNQLGMPDSVRK